MCYCYGQSVFYFLKKLKSNQIAMARKYIYFDIETTKRGPDAEIIQIGAVGGQKETPEFTVTVCPRGEISEGATQVHGYEKRSGRLIQNGNPVATVDLSVALKMFQDWILKNYYENSAVLVAHNAFSHKASILIREMLANGFEDDDLEGLLLGFADTLPTFKYFYPDLPCFTLKSLLGQFGITSYRLHDAKQDALYLLHLASVGARRKEMKLDSFVMMNFKDIMEFF